MGLLQVHFAVSQRLDGSPAGLAVWWLDPMGLPHSLSEQFDEGATWAEVRSIQARVTEAIIADPW